MAEHGAVKAPEDQALAHGRLAEQVALEPGFGRGMCQLGRAQHLAQEACSRSIPSLTPANLDTISPFSRMCIRCQGIHPSTGLCKHEKPLCLARAICICIALQGLTPAAEHKE